MSNQFSIALLLCGIVSSVLFGIGATGVLSIPSLSVHAALLLPIVVVASVVLAPFISWVIAPMMRAKWSRDQNVRLSRFEQPKRASA